MSVDADAQDAHDEPMAQALAEARGPAIEAALLYGGEQAATRRGVRIVPWARLDRWVRTLF